MAAASWEVRAPFACESALPYILTSTEYSLTHVELKFSAMAVKFLRMCSQLISIRVA